MLEWREQKYCKNYKEIERYHNFTCLYSFLVIIHVPKRKGKLSNGPQTLTIYSVFMAILVGTKTIFHRKLFNIILDGGKNICYSFAFD
jgi:hypothetical protein